MPSLHTLKKAVDSVFLILFVTIISLPLLTSLTSNRNDIRQSEKRKAAELPDLKPNKESLTTYPKRFESYYDDNFGFREELIHLHNLIKVFAFEVSPSKRVVLGKNGWLFYSSDWDGNPIADYRNLDLFSQKVLERKARQLERRNDWLKRQGIEYLYVIVPNKNSVYPEYIPNYLNRVRKHSLLDQFAGFVKENTRVSLIDLRPDLIAVKQEMPVYAQTGSHWNDFGAYVASNVILDKLNSWYAEIRPSHLPTESFRTRSSSGDDLALMIGMDNVMAEQAIVGPNRSLDCDNKKPIETPRFTRYWGKSFSLNCNKTKYRALVFRDSFSEQLIPYLSEQFGYIAYVWTRPNDKSFSWFVNKHKPDVVIEIHVERYLRTYP
jgi:hypothetical protein